VCVCLCVYLYAYVCACVSECVQCRAYRPLVMCVCKMCRPMDRCVLGWPIFTWGKTFLGIFHRTPSDLM